MRRWLVVAFLLIMLLAGAAAPVDAQNLKLTPVGTFDSAEVIAWSPVLYTFPTGDSLAYQILASRSGDKLTLWNVLPDKGIYRRIALPIPVFEREYVFSETPVGGIAFSPDGSTVVVAGMQQTTTNAGMREQGVIWRWDVTNGKLLAPWSAGESNIYGEPYQGAYSPDGSSLAFSFSLNSSSCQRYSGYVALLDAHTGDLITTFEQSRAPVLDLAFSPDGSTLAAIWGIDACVPGQGKLVLWDARAQTEIASAAYDHRVEESVLAFSPDGSLLVTSARPSYEQPGSMLHVWDASTLEEQAAYSLDAVAVSSLVFSPDGSALLVGDEQGMLHLIDMDSGEEIASVMAHTAPITDLAFSPDGALLATVAEDGGRLWR